MFLIFFKKVRFNLFSDIKFNINIISNSKIENKKLKNNVNTDNYCLVYKELNLIKYLKLFSISGEYILKLK